MCNTHTPNLFSTTTTTTTLPLSLSLSLSLVSFPDGTAVASFRCDMLVAPLPPLRASPPPIPSLCKGPFKLLTVSVSPRPPPLEGVRFTRAKMRLWAAEGSDSVTVHHALLCTNNITKTKKPATSTKVSDAAQNLGRRDHITFDMRLLSFSSPPFSLCPFPPSPLLSMRARDLYRADARRVRSAKEANARTPRPKPLYPSQPLLPASSSISFVQTKTTKKKLALCVAPRFFRGFTRDKLSPSPPGHNPHSFFFAVPASSLGSRTRARQCSTKKTKKKSDTCSLLFFVFVFVFVFVLSLFLFCAHVSLFCNTE